MAIGSIDPLVLQISTSFSYLIDIYLKTKFMNNSGAFLVGKTYNFVSQMITVNIIERTACNIQISNSLSIASGIWA
jgi:hypothetical protein